MDREASSNDCRSHPHGSASADHSDTTKRWTFSLVLAAIWKEVSGEFCQVGNCGYSFELHRMYHLQIWTCCTLTSCSPINESTSSEKFTLFRLSAFAGICFVATVRFGSEIGTTSCYRAFLFFFFYSSWIGRHIEKYMKARQYRDRIRMRGSIFMPPGI